METNRSDDYYVRLLDQCHSSEAGFALVDVDCGVDVRATMDACKEDKSFGLYPIT